MSDNNQLTPPTASPRRSRGVIAYFVTNPVSANLLMIVLVIGGFFASWQIKKEVFPEFSLDTVSISVSYPGASPEDVEQGIVLVVEEALQGLTGIDEVQSTAKEGSASIIAELSEDADANTVFQDIQQAVSRINTLPEDAEQPTVSLTKRVREVLDLLIYGDAPETTLRELAETVRDQLLSAEGVTQVELDGAREYRIHIDISSAQLEAYGLSLIDISSRIANAALDSSGGSVKTDSGEILVRVAERRDQLDQFANLPIISNSSGAVVLLGEIATITRGFDETSNNSAWFNGKQALSLEVFRIGDQTPDGVSTATRTALEEIRNSLPEDIEIAIRNDRAEIYKQRLELLLKNGFLGLLLVFGLMALFLEMKLAFWVTMGIPISFLGTLLFMPGMDASINMISMFAFIVSLGIVVDDAIVAGENIYEYRQRGMGLVDAAIEGAKDIAMPVTFSVLSNIIAFLPILFIPGMLGKIWGVIPLVVCTVFAVSLIEALLILPAHLAHSKPIDKRSKLSIWQQNFAASFDAWVLQRYQPSLEAALSHRYFSLAVGSALLMVVLAYAASGRMGMELMPSVESDYSEVRVSMPVGTPAHTIREAAKVVEQSAQQVIDEYGGSQLSEGIYTLISDDSIRTRVYLTAASVRPISTGNFTNIWQQNTPAMASAQSVRFASDSGGPGSGPSLTIELRHRDVNSLDLASAALAEALEDFPQVSGIDDGFQKGKQQLDITLTDAGRSLGLTAQGISRQVRASLLGNEVLRQQDGRNEVRVLVRLPENERKQEHDLLTLPIKTDAGTYVPLNVVANLERTHAFATIDRRDGNRTVNVSARVTPASEANQVLSVVTETILPELKQDFPGLSYSLEGRQAELRESIAALGWGMLVACGAIYILLAVPFASYIQPAIVMAAIPFGIFGAIIGHVIMGYSMSIISMMGVIALSGVVVNDSLVMVHYANQRRKQGDDAFTAIALSGARRFRPILLTTLSTFGGLAPMIFETSRQAQFMIPMAISMGYGIVFATAITLVLVPCMYLMVEDFKGLFQKEPSDANTSPKPVEAI